MEWSTSESQLTHKNTRTSWVGFFSTQGSKGLCKVLSHKKSKSTHTRHILFLSAWGFRNYKMAYLFLKGTKHLEKSSVETPNLHTYCLDETFTLVFFQNVFCPYTELVYIYSYRSSSMVKVERLCPCPGLWGLCPPNGCPGSGWSLLLWGSPKLS